MEIVKKGKSERNGTTLITGASAGIGAELARVFAANGHDLVLVARSADKLEALAAELENAHGITATVLPGDLGHSDACETIYLEVDRAGIEVDILVNNAGLLYRGPFLDTPSSDHLKLLQLNIVALTEMTHYFLPAMKERGAGRIMNIASTSAFQPLPSLSTYAASKAYVVSLTVALASELKESGITATALCPGFTETEMIAKDGGKSMKVPFVRNLSAAQVAQQGYDACMAGKPLYINGMSNRVLVEFGRYQPRWMQRLFNETFTTSKF